MLWDSLNSWEAFSASCWLWKHFPCKKLSRCLKNWQSVGKRSGVEYDWWGKASYPSSFNFWNTDCVTYIVMKKNRAHPIDQCWMQELPILVHFINLLSILLRCNSFLGIQKVVVDQTGSRPPNSDQDLFLVQVWLWEVLWSFFEVQPLRWPSPVIIKIHFSLHVTIQSRNGSLL